MTKEDQQRIQEEDLQGYGPAAKKLIRSPRNQGPMNDLQVELIPFKTLNERVGSPFEKLNIWLENLDDRLQGRETP